MGAKEMSSVLVVDPDKCTTCRLCELVCSEGHEGAYRPSRANIRVVIHAEEAFYFPMVCVQCDDAPCIEVCPTYALVRDRQTNAVVVVKENCNDCGLCEVVCPYKAIRRWDGKAHVCDLCGGDPECVKFCGPGALRYEPRESWPKEKRQAYADRLGDLAEEVKS